MKTDSKENKNTKRWWILANVSLGTFMATLDGSITNVALPSISGSLVVPLHIVQWVITAYLLTIASLLPIIGKMSDLFGRGKMYKIGFLIFIIGSALCGLSHSIGMLIGMRVVQAAGAALLMANSQSIVASIFTKEERGRALGITGTVVSLGSLTGPAIGGILVSWLGWDSIFWINIPIGLLGFIAALRLMPKKKVQIEAEPFDYTGSVLYMVGMVAFLYTLSNAEAWGWATLATIAGLVLSAALLAAFYRREKSISYPMLDFSLYRIHPFRTGSIAALLSFVSLFFVNVMMPFYMQNVLGFSPHIVGYVMMANPIMMAVVAPLSGWLSDKIGPLFLTTAGLLFNTASFSFLTLLSTGEPAWRIALQLAVFGIGTGMFQSPNNSSILGSVPRQQLGSAGGLNALVRNIGMVLGTTLSISLFSFQFSRQTGSHEQVSQQGVNQQAYLASLHTVFWAAAGICLLAAFISSRRGLRQAEIEGMNNI